MLLSDVYLHDLAEPLMGDAEGLVDDIKFNESQAHAERETRWRADVRRSVTTAEFEVLLTMSNKCKSPLDHYRCFVQKKLEDMP